MRIGGIKSGAFLAGLLAAVAAAAIVFGITKITLLHAG
jgi:hypothetical protein